ncbi:metal-binding protein [Betaproteobacteria bacterium]|nr:metal-binding protein [Betaproteobacteria bacterium]
MGDLIALGFVVILLIVGFVFGSIGQSRHYRSIKTREFRLRHILLFNEKMPPTQYAGQEFALVSGSVIMGSDYFRQMIAGLKGIFGGRLTSFETMLDRGRREAILRMKEEAERMGANAIFNVRLETSTLSFSQQGNREGKGGLACAELMAYGTAWRAPADANANNP